MSKDDLKLLAWIVWRQKLPLVIAAGFYVGVMYVVITSDGGGLDSGNPKHRHAALGLFCIGGLAGLMTAWLFVMEWWAIAARLKIEDAKRAGQEGGPVAGGQPEAQGKEGGE